MKITFEVEEFFDDDNVWDCLFVKIDEGVWFIAQNAYGTEDIPSILKQINQPDAEVIIL